MSIVPRKITNLLSTPPVMGGKVRQGRCSIYTADRIQVALVLPFCEVVMIKYLETSRASRAPAARAFCFALTEVSLSTRYLSQWPLSLHKYMLR